MPVGQTVYVISCHMPNITWFSFPRSMLPSAGPSGATRRSRSWPRSGIGSSKLWPPTTKSLPIRCANVLFFFLLPPLCLVSVFLCAVDWLIDPRKANRPLATGHHQKLQRQGTADAAADQGARAAGAQALRQGQPGEGRNEIYGTRIHVANLMGGM